MQAPAIRPEVLALHRSAVVFDLHVDSIIQQRLFRYDVRKAHRPFMRRQPLFWHADLPRMQEGGYAGAAMGIHWFPWESERGWREAGRQLDYLDRLAATDPRVIRARTAEDVRTAHRTGRLALMPGVEGAHILNGRLERVQALAERGALYLTLTHFSRNAAATPGMGRGANETDGLTAFGKELVAALERARILVDLAHVNRRGVLDACAAAQKPVLVTHTACAALQSGPRAITDEGIRAVAATGGGIGIIFAPIFLRGRLDASLDAVVDHVLHVASLVGPQHLVLGTDLDGWIPTIPSDLRDCRDLPLFTQRLLDRGYGEAAVRGLLGENLLRIIAAVRGA